MGLTIAGIPEVYNLKQSKNVAPKAMLQPLKTDTVTFKGDKANIEELIAKRDKLAEKMKAFVLEGVKVEPGDSEDRISAKRRIAEKRRELTKAAISVKPGQMAFVAMDILDMKAMGNVAAIALVDNVVDVVTKKDKLYQKFIQSQLNKRKSGEKLGAGQKILDKIINTLELENSKASALIALRYIASNGTEDQKEYLKLQFQINQEKMHNCTNSIHIKSMIDDFA